MGDRAVTDEPVSEVQEAGEPDLHQGGQRIGLERDLQAALRREINQLEAGLVIIDDGVERCVDTGFIDITARDASGSIVVIELKTGKAGRYVIGQISSYMGALVAEEPNSKVRAYLSRPASMQRRKLRPA